MANTSACVGSPARANHLQDSQAISLHASACNALQRSLRELRNTDTDYDQAATQVKAALDAIATLNLIAAFRREVQHHG